MYITSDYVNTHYIRCIWSLSHRSLSGQVEVKKSRWTFIQQIVGSRLRCVTKYSSSVVSCFSSALELIHDRLFPKALWLRFSAIISYIWSVLLRVIQYSPPNILSVHRWHFKTPPYFIVKLNKFNTVSYFHHLLEIMEFHYRKK